MRVLMLGWEFPPFFAGGVGIVCHELTKALMQLNDLDITYVMPYGKTFQDHKNGVKILFANNAKIESLNSIKTNSKLDIKNVNTMMYAYDSPLSYSSRIQNLTSSIISQDSNSNSIQKTNFKSIKELYGSNLLEEVYLYAHRVYELCKDLDFDVIHAHDWTTIPAAILLKELLGKPFVLHVHITELNKTGGVGGHEEVLKIEREGLEKADLIISISNQISTILTNHYSVNPNKIRLIHNGGISDLQKLISDNPNPKEKIILYAGRVTMQKGPEYFLKAAKKVLEFEDNVKFIIAGSGDMLEQMIDLAHNLGISDKVEFPGFYTREEALILYSKADVFVMPSVLEPFGIVPLEAVARGTPTIISKQSGIAEVLENTFKVDFWDIDEMAHKMLALLRYPILHNDIRSNAFKELEHFDWKYPAKKVVDCYHEVLNK